MTAAKSSAPSAEDSRDQPDAPHSRHLTTFQLGWLVIVIATVTVRAYTMSSWSWYQDDLVFTSRVTTMSFGDYLTQNNNGHITPAGNLLFWAMTRLDPLQYAWAAVVGCVLAGGSVVAWGLALRRIFGERLHLLVALVLIGLGPLATLSSLWWLVVINVFPLYTSMGLSVWFLARYVLGQRATRDLVGMTLAYAFGLLFWQKSLLISVVLLLTLALLSEGGVRARIVLALRALWPIALVSAVYLGAYVYLTTGSRANVSGEVSSRSLGQIINFYAHGLVDIALPSIVGGPFQALSSPRQAYDAVPSSVALFLWLGTLVALIMAFRYRRRAGLALSMTVIYAALSWGLILFSYRYNEYGFVSVRVGRYTADILPVALLTTMFICTRVLGAGAAATFRKPLLPRARRADIRKGVLAYAVLSSVIALIMTGRMWDNTVSNSPKYWLDNLQADARDAGKAVLINDPAPAEVIDGDVFQSYARISEILRPLDLPLRYNEPTDRYVVVDPRGEMWVGEMKTISTESVAPGPDGPCGYAVDQDMVTSIPMTQGLFAFGWVVDLEYFTGSDAQVEVSADSGRPIELALTSPAAGAGGHLQFYLEDSIGQLSFRGVQTPESVCVTKVRVGVLEPSDQRPPGIKD
jgi:hypothetical protein